MSPRRDPHRTGPLALVAWALAACGDCGPSPVPTAPHIAVDPLDLDFGDLAVLNTRELSVVARSIGRAPVSIDTLRIEEPGVPFEVAPLQGRTIPIESGSQQSIPVRFTPTDEACYQATLYLHNDDDDLPDRDVRVPLKGCGKTKACITVSPGLAFGIVCESTGAVQRFTVKAGCTADLIVKDIRFEPGSSDAFSFLGNTTIGPEGLPVPLGKEMVLTVIFQPKPGGPVTHSGTIVIASTDPANPVVKIPVTATVNRAPVPVVKKPANAAPGQTVTFDGSESADPDGHLPLACTWKVVNRPLSSGAAPRPTTGMTTQVTLDWPGEYLVELTCTDTLGCRSSAPGSAEIVARPSQDLYVELVWNHDTTDLDLHFLAPGGTFQGVKDCWYGNPKPDFGIQGDPADDPSLDRDDLEGFGPEIVGYAKPPQATAKYTIVVHFIKTNGAHLPDPAKAQTEGTVRIYEFGVIKAEFKQVLDKAGLKWTVGTVEWPSGAIQKDGTVN